MDDHAVCEVTARFHERETKPVRYAESPAVLRSKRMVFRDRLKNRNEKQTCCFISGDGSPGSFHTYLFC
jgi:hypothetical protein